MNDTAHRLVVAIATAMVVPLASGAGLPILEKEIASSAYPFFADAKRAAAIRSAFRNVRKGMSAAEVKAALGEPDEVRSLYASQMKRDAAIGYTYWYVIRRLAQHGSENQKQESLVRVSFHLDDRVFAVDSWGL